MLHLQLSVLLKKLLLQEQLLLRGQHTVAHELLELLVADYLLFAELGLLVVHKLVLRVHHGLLVHLIVILRWVLAHVRLLLRVELLLLLLLIILLHLIWIIFVLLMVRLFILVDRCGDHVLAVFVDVHFVLVAARLLLTGFTVDNDLITVDLVDLMIRHVWLLPRLQILLRLEHLAFLDRVSFDVLVHHIIDVFLAFTFTLTNSFVAVDVIIGLILLVRLAEPLHKLFIVGEELLDDVDRHRQDLPIVLFLGQLILLGEVVPKDNLLIVGQVVDVDQLFLSIVLSVAHFVLVFSHLLNCIILLLGLSIGIDHLDDVEIDLLLLSFNGLVLVAFLVDFLTAILQLDFLLWVLLL